PPISIVWAGGEIPFFVYKFRRLGASMLVAFTIWDTSRGRPLTQPSGEKSIADWWAWRTTDIREARQHQPAQLLTIAVSGDGDISANLPALLSSLISRVAQ